MSEKDYMVRALGSSEQVRAYALSGKGVVEEACRRHHLTVGAAIALGRTMMGTLLLGATLKGDDKLTVKINGGGPLGSIVVDGNGHGTVKGYVQHEDVELPKDENGIDSLASIVGTNGVVTVIKDLGLKEPFSGQTPIVSGEIGDDLTYYLASSEQIPSAIGLSAAIDEKHQVLAAGGFMLQVLPGASDEVVASLEEKIKAIGSLSKRLEKGETPEDILRVIFGADLKILDKLPVSFRCDCSKEKFAAVIVALGEKEITNLIEEDHGAEAVCRFCGKKYHYSEDELKQLLKDAQE